MMTIVMYIFNLFLIPTLHIDHLTNRMSPCNAAIHSNKLQSYPVIFNVHRTFSKKKKCCTFRPMMKLRIIITIILMNNIYFHFIFSSYPKKPEKKVAQPQKKFIVQVLKKTFLCRFSKKKKEIFW
jgi:hypothetical protein